MPGKHQLAAELGGNNKTVEGALKQLEKTGLLLPQGGGEGFHESEHFGGWFGETTWSSRRFTAPI